MAERLIFFSDVPAKDDYVMYQFGKYPDGTPKFQFGEVTRVRPEGVYIDTDTYGTVCEPMGNLVVLK